MVFGAAGNIGWGALCDWVTRRGYPDAIFRVFIPLLLFAPILLIPAFIIRMPEISIPGYMIASLVYTGFGPALAALQLAAPDHLRGRLTSIKLVATSIIGLGLGPVVAGLITDHVFASREMLGEAMAMTIFGASIVGALCLIAGRRGYLRALEAQNDPLTSSAVDLKC